MIMSTQSNSFVYTLTSSGTYTWRFRRVSLNSRSSGGIAYFDDFKVSSTIQQSQQVCSSPKNYRFGFNTQEKDDEVYGAGNLNTAEFWEYDTRIGRRWNTDPEEEIFPWQSPYVSLVNNPIVFVDDEGDIPWYYILKFKNGSKVTSVSNVGMRLHPIHKTLKMHKGNDFRADIGTPVRAFAEGKVIFVGAQRNKKGKLVGAGYYIKIQHQSGYITKYFHLQKGSFLVNEGDHVADGQQIANSGNTGGSTGPHLHMETWKGTKFYNAKDIGDLQQRINNELGIIQQKIFRGYTCTEALIVGKRPNVSKNEGSTNNDLNQNNSSNSSDNSSSNSSNNNSSNEDGGNNPRFVSPRYVNQ
jgi:murein DD-endopeptidase MepM/ murein hydrolase activator NlpD